MKVRVLGCCGARLPGLATSCLLVDDRLLIDAGAAVTALALDEQLAVDDLLLSHAHLDHVAELPFLVDNLCLLRERPLRVWAPAPVLETLRRHLFNDELWPDFTRLPQGRRPILELHPLEPGQPRTIAGLEVRWAATTHPVPCAGYCLSSATAGLLYSGDTGPTEALWALARQCPELNLVFVETSFPNRLQDLAMQSGHLTPALLATELTKLGRSEVPVKVFHLKPQFIDELMDELSRLGDARLQILRGGEEFVL